MAIRIETPRTMRRMVHHGRTVFPVGTVGAGVETIGGARVTRDE